VGAPAGESWLAGPRGRELCLSVAAARDAELARTWLLAGRPPAPECIAAAVAGLARCDAAVLHTADEATVLWPLADTVCSAMYWQAPWEREALLEVPLVRAALLPVARSLAGAPGAAWWSSPIARDRQHVLTWEHGGRHPQPDGAAAALRAWSAELVEQGRRDRAASYPLGAVSGSWWSAPIGHGLLVSTRSLLGYPAIRLLLVEECQGDFDSALVRRLEIDPAARVLEIAAAADWVQLTATYPLDVTGARRHDWYRVTGWTGRWVVPDWAAVAAEWDGVHLSVAAYLAGAGRALPVGDAATMIAGWDPDATYWLTDAARCLGPTRRWRQLRGGEHLDWAAAD
jgi:hypothetical protein